MPMRRALRFCLLLLLSLAAASTPAAPAGTDWPQFRGAGRDGRSPVHGLARAWPEGGPKVLWKQPIGSGFSSLAVVADRLYTMAAEGDKEYALCLDAASGRELWRTEVGERFVEEFGDGPRSTPTVDGDTVYVLGSKGGLHALAAADGGKRWSVDLVATFGTEVPRWGFAPSPLLDGDRLILETGGKEGKAIAALDKQTGQTRWTLGEGAASYSSPIAVEIAGARQYVFYRRSAPTPMLIGVTPDGKLAWSHPAPPGGIVSPLFIPPDQVYFSAGDDAGALLVRLRAENGVFQASEVWRNPRMKNHFHPAVLVDGHLYGFDNATFKSIAVADGAQTWATRGFGKGSIVLADGLLIVLSDEGALALVEANPESYVERARAQVLSGRTWTSPSLAGTRLYVRNLSEIACLELGS